MSVNDTLDQRGSRYGDFTDHARIAQGLQNVMREGRKSNGRLGWQDLNDIQKQALTVIADKIARIISGDPNYDDNWHDIQGYAKLVEDRLSVPTPPASCVETNWVVEKKYDAKPALRLEIPPGTVVDLPFLQNALREFNRSMGYPLDLSL